MQIKEIEDYVVLKSEKNLDAEIKKYTDLGFERAAEGFKIGDILHVAFIKYKKD